MVHHHRLYSHHLSMAAGRRLICNLAWRPSKPAALFLLLSLLYCSSFLLFRRTNSNLQYPSIVSSPPPCSSIPNNTICCDSTSPRSDVCFMRGDVRTHSPSSSLLLLHNSSACEHRIRPYTRKWEPTTMSTIDELNLRSSTSAASCDVHHDVPAVVFSTGGYTGNVYHEFNDGILPLYITAHRFNLRVSVVLLEYHDWWVTKYADILSRISDQPLIDFSGDRRTHCFPEAIVGLHIHGELTIDPSKTPGGISGFRRLLDDAYRPRVRAIEAEEAVQPAMMPKLVIVSRNRSRAIENEAEVAAAAEAVGFRVEVLQPTPEMELAKIYRALNGCEAMVGVHGAAMTHFLFMRPRRVFIQVVPLGTEWAAEEYYGAPAKRMGLRYVAYRVAPRESSLYREYGRDDPVLRDPESVNAKGWETTKRVYLDGQKVKLDVRRFRKRLVKAYQYLVREERLKER